MAKISFIAIPFISPMSVDIQEKMNLTNLNCFQFRDALAKILTQNVYLGSHLSEYCRFELKSSF